jgi:hypothetical protein
MGALRMIVTVKATPEQVKQHFDEREIWVLGKTRTGRATLFTLMPAHTVDEIYQLQQKMTALCTTGVLDEWEYKVPLTEKKAVTIRMRPIWWVRWGLVLVDLLRSVGL